MYTNKFPRFIFILGLTLPLIAGTSAITTFAQPAPAQEQIPTIKPVVGAIIYKFPGITYSTAGYLDYNGKHFTGNQISVTDSAIGKQVTVTLSHGVDTFTTFTLLLPNDPIRNYNAQITAVGITIHRVIPAFGNTSYTLLKGTVSRVLPIPINRR